MELSTAIQLIDAIQESYPFAQRLNERFLVATEDTLTELSLVCVFTILDDPWTVCAGSSIVVPAVVASNRKFRKLVDKYAKPLKKNGFNCFYDEQRLHVIIPLTTSRQNVADAREAGDVTTQILMLGYQGILQKLGLLAQ